MKKIKKYVDWICEEVESAKCYAERYVYCKAKGSQWAAKYHQMAMDELQHADVIHHIAVEEIEQINTVFKAPQEMQDAWDKSHVEYVERAAWVRKMLEM